MAKKKKTKIEFSKKIFYLITTFAIIVIIYSMALMWKTNDSSGLAYLIPSVLGELGVATGFYYNKAKKENEIKLMQKYGKDIVNITNGEENESEE